jgi:hypothetical protein
MRRSLGAILGVVVCLALAAALTACGSGSRHSTRSHPAGATTATTSTGGSHPASAAPATAVTSPFVINFLPPPTKTSCRSVVYIGDSTSDGEASAEFVPNAKLRAPAQLSKVGVKNAHMEVSGARSIHEIYKGIPNAAMVARRHVAAGFHGCWILALGTNEAADVAAGSTFGLRPRIAQMMSIIGHQPVLWINEITLPEASAYYRESGMRRWNADLLSACNRYPTMRVFDWAAHAKPSWFIPDGIHYTPAGYIARTRLIAHALVKAFPRDRPPSAGCLVR